MMLGFSSRGLANWSDGERSRVVWGTGDGYLVEVDARSGEAIREFGEDGHVDLIAGIPRARRQAPINYSVTSSPTTKKCHQAMCEGSMCTPENYYGHFILSLSLESSAMKLGKTVHGNTAAILMYGH